MVWILAIYLVVIIFFALSPDYNKWFLQNLAFWIFLVLYWVSKAAGSH